MADLISSGGGADNIVAGGSNDTALAGNGSDTIQGNDGSDLLWGGLDNDTIGGQAGNDILLGGAGNDQLDGGIGDDILSGGSGLDTFLFSGNFGKDVVADFTDGDRLVFLAGSGLGNASNLVISSTADLKALIDSNNWTVSVKNDAVTVDFGNGNSLTFVGLGDELTGGQNAASNNRTGTGGADLLFGDSDGGQMTGGRGNDVLLAAANNTNGNGGEDADTVVGGSANDLLGGGTGNDFVFGGGGNDVIDGGADNDWLVGDDGADTFLFKGAFGHDTIADLNFDENDKFNVSIGGTTYVVNSEASLANLIQATNATTTIDPNGSDLTITFGTGDSITLIGHAYDIMTV